MSLIIKLVVSTLTITAGIMASLVVFDALSMEDLKNSLGKVAVVGLIVIVVAIVHTLLFKDETK